MKKTFIIINSIIALLYAVNLFAQESSGLKVTFVSNEGFLITIGSKKVLIDALYTSVYYPNVAPTAGTIQKLENAGPPFDSIDLICITHDHNDHFDMNCVGKHLEKDKKAIVVCPNSVGNEFKKYANYSLIKDRIIQISPAFDSMKHQVINGIAVTILGCRHVMPDFQNMDHEGFLINYGGYRILHMGDSGGTFPDEFNAFKLQNDSIDIAFLEYDFFTNDLAGNSHPGLDRVVQSINPENIVVMHCNPVEYNGGQQIVDTLKTYFPNFYLFKNEFEEKELIKDTLTDISNPVGIEIRYNENFKIFPNPTTGKCNISFGSSPVQKALVEICNLHGNLFLSETFYNTTTETIDLTSFPKGICIVKVLADREIFNEKVCLE